MLSLYAPRRSLPRLERRTAPKGGTPSSFHTEPGERLTQESTRPTGQIYVLDISSRRNTIARHGRRGWRLDKPSLEQPNDSIIALCMALEAIDNQPAQVELIGWL